MLRQLNIPLDDLALDERGVSERINRELARRKLRIAGAGRAGDRLLVFCESADVPSGRCRIAPFDGFAPEELLAEVRGRYDAAFSTAAVWEYAGRMWGIFVRSPETAKEARP